MIEVTPFNNPFKKTTEVVSGEIVQIVVKNGKSYKKVIKK